MTSDGLILTILVVILGASALQDFYAGLSGFEAFLAWMLTLSAVSIGGLVFWEFRSKSGRERRARIDTIKELPISILTSSETSIRLGFEEDLRVPLFLPDSIRKRHVHILGATGSGKTESVILNFLGQDAARGLGAIILDAKGDYSFLEALRNMVEPDRLRVFDLGSESSMTYNPLFAGSELEAAQRLFSSLTWSEEYYRSKALSILQRLFQHHKLHRKTKPRLADLDRYLQDIKEYSSLTATDNYPAKLSEKDFSEISGLRDQIKTLCTGHLSKILSPTESGDLDLSECRKGKILYFRLQSLMSPQLVGTVGKFVINHLAYLAGEAHRDGAPNQGMIPIYLDEFASFACPEFADLISKARSAGFALHFSHQSIGDISEVSEGFLSRITDNAGTKIVLRINDPDSAEFFARCFGTRLYQKITQKLIQATDLNETEVGDEGTQREAHQFRACPDLFKTHPTGMGSVLIAHGEETPHGASSVFRVRFPRWTGSGVACGSPKTKVIPL
jgi:hypothetical protein